MAKSGRTNLWFAWFARSFACLAVLLSPTATPFTIHGDPVDTDFFRFGVGMSFVMAQGRSGFFYYERLISRERFSQNSLALGIRLEF